MLYSPWSHTSKLGATPSSRRMNSLSAADSIGRMSTVTPILRHWSAIWLSMSTRVVSAAFTGATTLNPLGYPASARSCRAFSGSYSNSSCADAGSSFIGTNAAAFLSLTGQLCRSASKNVALAIASRLVPIASARRTATLSAISVPGRPRVSSAMANESVCAQLPFTDSTVRFGVRLSVSL